MTGDGFPGSDRAAPAPNTYRAPRNARQEILCEIFAEVLRLPRVGIDDDFFTLGGRSVDGVLIAARANAALSCQVSLAALFDAPTVAELDRYLDEVIAVGPVIILEAKG